MKGTPSVPLLSALLLLAAAGIPHPGVAADQSTGRANEDSAAPIACEPQNVVRACIMSDRPAHLAAVIHSVLDTIAPTSCVEWELFTTEEMKPEILLLMQEELLLAPQSRHSARVITLTEAEDALEERGIIPVWHRPAFNRGASGSPRRTLWSLREPPAESDPKHSHPLNLLRFYMSELPWLDGDARVLLFDDDVCIRHDVSSLFHTEASTDDDAQLALMVASCQMQEFEPTKGIFNIRNAHFTYADTRFLGTVGARSGYKLCSEEHEQLEALAEDPDCNDQERAEYLRQRACAPAGLEPKLLQLHGEISGGQQSFRDEVAWNFGATLVHLDRWREVQMSNRLDRWFVANEHFGFFAPNSMSFGLGIAYLAFAGHVDCWPADTVIDGLGFLNWGDLSANGISKDDVEVRIRGSPALVSS